jgi:hypothetical protein
MARKKNDNVEVEEEQEVELTPEQLEKLEEFQEEQEDEAEEDREEQMEDQMELTEEMQKMYGAPEIEETHSAHTLLNKAMFIQPDTIKSTFLTESELGRPLFSVRFMLDLHKSATHYRLNKLQQYYWNKVQNITSSGLSNRGFGLNIAVTHKKDTTRRRLKEPISEKEVGK